MKLGMAICLCVGLSSPLAAQQTLLASSPPPFALPVPAASSVSALPGFPTTAPTAIGVVPQPLSPPGLAESAVAAGLSPDGTLYDAALPHDAICTEVLPQPLASDYAFDHAQFTAAALKAAFTHDNLVAMARNFVPGQPLPDAPDYKPLTTKQKFEAFLRNSHSVGMGVNILSDALVSQVTGAYPRFGGGMAGFGQRMGVSAAGAETAAFFGGFVYPTLFRQDPRYFPSHQHSIVNRLAYAASRALIGRSDSGMSVINSSVIASQFTEAAIANAYIPYRNETVSGTIENALTGLGGVAEGDILTEFWPDIKEFVFRHTHSSLVRRGMALGDPTGQQAFRSGSN